MEQIQYLGHVAVDILWSTVLMGAAVGTLAGVIWCVRVLIHFVF